MCAVCSGSVFMKVHPKPRRVNPDARTPVRDFSSILIHPGLLPANQKRVAHLKRLGDLPTTFFPIDLVSGSVTLPGRTEILVISGFLAQAATQSMLDQWHLDGSQWALGKVISGHQWRHRVMTVLADSGIDSSITSYILGHKQV